MNKQGFEDLLLRLPKKHTTSLLFGMESTASYHIALFSYLTAKGYQVAIINPLLIANIAKLSLRKTKTDKKDAFTIAQFLMLQREAIVQHRAFLHSAELRDLSRTITGIFTKSTLRLLKEYPSARAIREAGCDAVADIFIDTSKGNRPRATTTALMETAVSSVGVASPAKELIVRQESAFLLHLEEQIQETTKLLKSMCNENMKNDMDILTSMKGIGEKTAMNFLVEIGGDVRAYENDKKLIATAGLDPSTYHVQNKQEGE